MRRLIVSFASLAAALSAPLQPALVAMFSVPRKRAIVGWASAPATPNAVSPGPTARIKTVRSPTPLSTKPPINGSPTAGTDPRAETLTRRRPVTLVSRS